MNKYSYNEEKDEIRYSEKYILKRMRAEFDYIWDSYNREQHEEGRDFNISDYCLALETLILNRLNESLLYRYEFGKEGIPWLDKLLEEKEQNV